jgi:hypothetical protein
MSIHERLLNHARRATSSISQGEAIVFLNGQMIVTDTHHTPVESTKIDPLMEQAGFKKSSGWEEESSWVYTGRVRYY